MLGEDDRASYEAIEVAIREAHSYDEPEIIALPIPAGSPTTSHLAWIDDTVDP